MNVLKIYRYVFRYKLSPMDEISMDELSASYQFNPSYKTTTYIHIAILISKLIRYNRSLRQQMLSKFQNYPRNLVSTDPEVIGTLIQI